MSKTICDKCGRKFTIKLHTKEKGNLQIAYFKCPKCYEEYIVTVTDEELRKNMKKAASLRYKMLLDCNDKESIRDYHALKNKNCIREQELKKEYLGGI